MLTVRIIYASTSGNTEAVCARVAQELASHELVPELYKVDRTDIRTLITGELFILATSTWEHGRINPYWDKLLKDMPELELAGKYAGFIGLGDTRYEPVYFCEGVNLLQEKFLAAGGEQIGTPLKINGTPFPLLETEVVQWTWDWLDNLRRINRFKNN